ncbi:MarR family transcriptional regulator [Nitrosospira sp. Is2]|uniref:MarR family transcriptional regulator n=1 Tax=Nitrosospira sp. Is2 TaxID=3080532 RepID=UPI00295376D9|nr:MarR family transcriptional regulator [Nitrosospira sp. Is2]WON73799.1 MarR family transcriptional regulator [Nitrosospira sp. Is2]
MNTPCRYSDTRRREFIDLLNDTDQYWVEVMGDRLFHDLNYYDLFTRMWLRSNKARDGRNGLNSRNGSGGLMETFRKSELYQLMPNVSQRTAIKYIQIAIDNGLLVEQADPGDLRSRRITMSADLKRKIELFLDYSISVFEAFPRGDVAMGDRSAYGGAEHDA